MIGLMRLGSWTAPVNGDRFGCYVEQVLVPTLAAGDIVVLDNLGSHKSQPVRAAVRGPQERSPSALPAALQPRSEPHRTGFFAKLRNLLRKAAERTVEATWRRIGTLLNEFSPDECANYLVNSGYAST